MFVKNGTFVSNDRKVSISVFIRIGACLLVMFQATNMPPKMCCKKKCS